MSFSNITAYHGLVWTALTQQFHSYGVVIAVLLTIAIFQSNLRGILTAWPFFTRRYDFVKSNLEKSGRNMFTFNVLHHSVTAVRGLNARKAFFDDKRLDPNEGYKILMGAAPRLNDVETETLTVHKAEADAKERDVSLFIKRLNILLRRDRLQDAVPTLFDDMQKRMDGWGKEGSMDPFRNIYDIVFQMTVRMASCRELASDPAALSELQQHYWILEKSATPTALLLPWFPGPAKRAKEASTTALFTMLWNYVEDRRKASVPSSDAIDMLLSMGVDNQDIVQFVLGVIFAGVINTGINACWLLLYITFHEHWKTTVYNEVQAILARHTNASDPLHKRLSAVPISVWEDETPSIDLVLRETMRIVLGGTVLRRNVSGSESLKMPDGEVGNGAFMAYSLTDAHMNPNVYTDPEVFDPERFSPGREEDKRETYAFLGWGAGRHPCAGMKIAKLEIKMIVAMFVIGYEYELVDSQGRRCEKLPVPDYNDIQQARPKGDPCFIRFKRVVE